MLKWYTISLAQSGSAGIVDTLLCKQACIFPPRALDRAALSQSQGQHKVDFHSKSEVESPS